MVSLVSKKLQKEESLIISSAYNNIIALCKNLNCTFLKNEPMKNHTSFKIGGPADLFIYAQNEETIKPLIKEIKKDKLPFFVLGNGSNLLVSDKGYRGIIISLTKNFKKITLEKENIICCEAGASLGKACVFAMKNNLAGLEFAWGIPGSCGGALFMNAGAYGSDISNIIMQSTHITSEGYMKTVPKESLNLSYRKSVYCENDFIITSVKLILEKSCHENIKLKMHENILKRKTKQPLEFPNAGSVFKRPAGYYTGELIQNCGLKGMRVGDAQISPKHTGFIINVGNATAKDVCRLILYVKETVFKKTGVNLECEVKTLGNIKI